MARLCASRSRLPREVAQADVDGCPSAGVHRPHAHVVTGHLCPQGADPLGCGDALLATATLALCAGGSLQAAALGLLPEVR